MTDGATGRAQKSTLDPAQLLHFGKERTDAMISMQKELLDAYQETAQAWVSRVKSETAFWADLAAKLAATRSVPEGLQTYQESISHRMQMAAEDGRRLFEDGQKMIAAVTKSLVNHQVGKAKSE